MGRAVQDPTWAKDVCLQSKISGCMAVTATGTVGLFFVHVVLWEFRVPGVK